MKPYSTNPKVVKQRTRLLTDDEFAARQAAYKKRYHARKVAKHVTDQARLRARQGSKTAAEPSKGLRERVLRHHERGRDVGDIAVREGVLASVVERILKGPQ